MADSGWIVTYTGRRFYPLAPRIEDIDIEDIAHALSNMCRFTGHCRQFYSVAQHSILAAYHAPAWLKLAMLLHDASEAYLCDLSRPVKHSPGLAAYRAAEDRLQQLVGQRFGVVFDDPMVKQIDDRMLMTERRDLTDASQPWSSHHLPPYEEIIYPLSPGTAKEVFLDYARELL
jgi:hypothetical protein